MRKILFAATLAASVCALPAIAQDYPESTTAAAQSNATVLGAQAGTDTSATTSTTASGTSQPLGLSGLLQQAQQPAANPAANTATDGAGPTGSLAAKVRARKAGSQGH